MSKTKFDISSFIRSNIDILCFIVCLFGANFIWKSTIMADENGSPVYLFSMNISLPFDYMCRHITTVVYSLITLTRQSVHYFPPDTLNFDSGSGIRIIWGCTAIKQAFIFLVIMLFAPKVLSWHKLWYIPLGLIVVYVFNILRIYLIALIIEHNPHLFDLLHNYIFKYLFYFVIFLVWCLWTEVINKLTNQIRK